MVESLSESVYSRKMPNNLYFDHLRLSFLVSNRSFSPQLRDILSRHSQQTWYLGTAVSAFSFTMAAQMQHDAARVRTIIALGITGAGKSTTCNCLCGVSPSDPDCFRESTSMAAETSEYKMTLPFEHDGDLYKIIDTVGPCDPEQEPTVVFEQLAQAFNAAQHGIDQILIITSGRVTQAQLDIISFLTGILLNEDVWDIVAVVRTRFAKAV